MVEVSDAFEMKSEDEENDRRRVYTHGIIVKHDLEIVREDGEEVDNGEEGSRVVEELFPRVGVADELRERERSAQEKAWNPGWSGRLTRVKYCKGEQKVSNEPRGATSFRPKQRKRLTSNVKSTTIVVSRPKSTRASTGTEW